MFSVEYKTKINEKIVSCHPSELSNMLNIYDYALDNWDREWIDDWLKVEARLLRILPAWTRLFPRFRIWLVVQVRYAHWRGFQMGTVTARKITP